MATCDPFDVTIQGDVQSALDRAREKITQSGGQLTGDTSAGTFSGPTPLGDIKGAYQVAGQVVTVRITSRPWLAPCGVIETTVREFFA